MRLHDPLGVRPTLACGLTLILLSAFFSKITFYPRFFVLAFFVGNPRFFEKRGVKKSSLFSSPSAFLKVHLGVNGRRLNLQMHT